MDLIEFEKILRNSLSNLSYIKNVKIKQRTEISLEGIINLKNNYKLKIFFNEVYYIISFNLIKNNKRIWAIDRDNRIKWHLHPIYSANIHKKINAMSIPEIIFQFDLTMKKIYNS